VHAERSALAARGSPAQALSNISGGPEMRFGARARSRFTHSIHAHRNALAPCDGAHSVKFSAPSEQENLPLSLALVARRWSLPKCFLVMTSRQWRYIIYHIYHYIWTIFSYVFNLTFCKRNNAKIILLIIYCVLIIILLFFLYQTIILQKYIQKVYINIISIYKHISYIIIYIFIYTYIYVYIFI